MAISVLEVHRDGTVAVWHDEANHGGTVTLADFRPRRDAPDLPADSRYTIIACPEPGCDAASLYPASGGSDPEMVQRLFVHLILANPDIPSRSWPAAKTLLKRMVTELDGDDRWRLEDASETDE